jgi:DNA-directed RNA polymerase specialized sigma24 family protein
MQNPSISISSEQEHFMLTCLEQFRPMILRLTQGMETDDAIQEAALIILQTLPQVSACRANPIAYMSRIVRNQLITRYRQAQHTALSTMSIEQPLHEDSERTLADLLPAPNSVDEFVRDQALYDALHHLPDEEQAHVKQRYDLYSFTPRYPSGRRVRHGRSARSLMRTALKQLRQDRRLQQAIVPIGPA